MGSVIGNLIVEDGATASVRGIVSQAVINRGGSVEVFGAVGSITGTERSHINPGAGWSLEQARRGRTRPPASLNATQVGARDGLGRRYSPSG